MSYFEELLLPTFMRRIVERAWSNPTFDEALLACGHHEFLQAADKSETMFCRICAVETITKERGRRNEN